MNKAKNIFSTKKFVLVCVVEPLCRRVFWDNLEIAQKSYQNARKLIFNMMIFNFLTTNFILEDYPVFKQLFNKFTYNLVTTFIHLYFFVSMFVCPTVSKLRFYGCCHPRFKLFIPAN